MTQQTYLHREISMTRINRLDLARYGETAVTRQRLAALLTASRRRQAIPRIAQSQCPPVRYLPFQTKDKDGTSMA